jgi:hypothetical protein
VLGDDLRQALAVARHLLSLDADVGLLSLEAAADQRLVDHHARVRQDEALALRAGGQQDRAEAHRHAHAQGRDRRAHELHRVVHRQARGHHAAGRIDVQVDVLLVVLAVEVQQLGDQVVGRVGRDRAAVAADEDDALLQKARKDVVGGGRTAGPLLENGGKDVGHE